jgi:hypothetical protein
MLQAMTNCSVVPPQAHTPQHLVLLRSTLTASSAFLFVCLYVPLFSLLHVQIARAARFACERESAEPIADRYVGDYCSDEYNSKKE